jgi:hypothetical protein
MKNHPYYKKTFAFATMHEKEKAIQDLLYKKFQAQVIVPSINTDELGTFCGRIPRQESPFETAKKKARRALEVTGLPLALASEGSFVTGPFGFGIVNHELMVLIDTQKDVAIQEKLVSYKTNYARTEIKWADVEGPRFKQFLKNCQFGTHALMVYTISHESNSIIKGITQQKNLIEAIKSVIKKSGCDTVIVETDMRAHLNPTRMQNIKELSKKMVLRLANLCTHCNTPGFGCTEFVAGLPCELCDAPTDGIKQEIHSCAKCGYTQLSLPADNPRYFANPAECSICNP